MKAYEITFSPTGGTKKIADIILSACTYESCEKKEISLLLESTAYSQYAFTKDDVCIIAVPSFGGRVPATAAKRIASMQGNAAKAVLVCVYGNRAYEDTLIELKNIVKQAGFRPIAAVAAVAEHSIMRQFAAGRPDAEDKAELNRFAEAIWESVSSDEVVAEVEVPGNTPYKQYGVLPLCPGAGVECSGCGACAVQCPVGAIDTANPKKTDESKCISCMRCVAVCPQKARSVPGEVLTALSEKMAKAFETRKENELFIG